jgi:Zn-dependent membrane protease YugP
MTYFNEFVDPINVLYLVPLLWLTFWARARVAKAVEAGSRLTFFSGLSGAEAAATVLKAAGSGAVRIERVDDEPTDYYDPGGRVLRLSPIVYEGRSLAAVGVAAHEAGHAAQHAGRFFRLLVPRLTVFAAGIGSSVAWMVTLAGFVFGLYEFVQAGVSLSYLNVALQLAGLPLEFDASRRARQALESAGLVDASEADALARVLDAAAWVHVAEPVMAAPTRLGRRLLLRRSARPHGPLRGS